MMKTVKKTARSRSVTVCSRFFIMNGSPIKNRNGKMNGTGRSQCERDGRMNGNGSGLKKLPSNADSYFKRLMILNEIIFIEGN